MGCWGFGILDSDDSMDAEAELLRVADIEPYADEHEPPEAVKQKLADSVPALIAFAQAQPTPEGVTYFRAVTFQVLSSLLMEHGVSFTAEQRDELVQGSLLCNEYEFTCALLKEIHPRPIEAADLERHRIKAGFRGHRGTIERLYGRKAALDELACLLRNYALDGSAPVKVSQDEGLLEKLTQAVACK